MKKENNIGLFIACIIMGLIVVGIFLFFGYFYKTDISKALNNEAKETKEKTINYKYISISKYEYSHQYNLTGCEATGCNKTLTINNKKVNLVIEKASWDETSSTSTMLVKLDDKLVLTIKNNVAIPVIKYADVLNNVLIMSYYEVNNDIGDYYLVGIDSNGLILFKYNKNFDFNNGGMHINDSTYYLSGSHLIFSGSRLTGDNSFYYDNNSDNTLDVCSSTTDLSTNNLTSTSPLSITYDIVVSDTLSTVPRAVYTEKTISSYISANSLCN
jgi:hypothetical protein